MLDKFHFNDFNATGLEVKKVAARISTHHFERKKREEEEENEKKKIHQTGLLGYFKIFFSY